MHCRWPASPETSVRSENQDLHALWGEKVTLLFKMLIVILAIAASLAYASIFGLYYYTEKKKWEKWEELIKKFEEIKK